MSDSQEQEQKKPSGVYLACYDGSAKSKQVLEYLVEHARSDARIYLLGMTEVTEQYASKASDVVSGSIAKPSPADAAIAEQRKERAALASYRLLAARQVLLDGGLADSNIRELVLESADVRDTVVDTAHKYHADTIVVGSRGHGAVKRAVLGSLSTHLTHHFDGNVVVCRGPEDAE
jgi:nucleotide-binding universal stress UspA family protein